MVELQNKIDSNGTVQELLTKEIGENDKVISENAKFKELSDLIHKRANLEYKIKSNTEYVAKVEKKHKKGDVESTFNEMVVKFNADMKKISENKDALNILSEKYNNILTKFNNYAAKVRELLQIKPAEAAVAHKNQLRCIP